ncbi:kyphoscoliosis peptidase-like isoform X2 [Brachyhypopomus gauderio]|uniref:kyphoscoliosis peptidase-like isoform X2 n=1 Tax=Brachyhypopomus gauderio TaxID=698409 RepID=UPI0040432C6C
MAVVLNAPHLLKGFGHLPSNANHLHCVTDDDDKNNNSAAVSEKLKRKKVFSVETIAQTITEGASTDLERLRAIWIWLCDNIEYDVSGYLGVTEKVCSPERVVETGRAVCCGYSSVCLHMCKGVGLECKEVSGHGKGAGYRPGMSYQNIKSNHSWNAVRLEDHWYLLDACWGAGKVDMDNRVFMKRYNEFYFLTDPEDFINSHCPDEEEWQLLENPVHLEEFEKMVLKTSEFYRLGLTLIHPKHFLLITENGEASITLGLSQPVDFTYQILQCSGCEQQEVSSSVGLLTVTQTTMKLCLQPPTAGSFEVMLFARRGDASGMFVWVCSFQVECPRARPARDLPENPFLCWGTQPSCRALGLEPRACGNEAVALTRGSFELVLHTTRALMMLCELSHKDLAESLAKRCLSTQIEVDKLTCNVLCPFTGYYRLSVFVRDYERSGDSFRNAGNFLIHCTGNPINLNELFPPALSNCCGPGISTSLAGLSQFSHTEAVVSTQQGQLNITFQNQRDLDIHAVLSKEQQAQAGNALSRHVFIAHVRTEVTVSVTLPEPGVYKLGLYASASAGQDFAPLCDFVVRNSAEAGQPPFPLAFAAWGKGCVLLAPRAGLLEPRSRVRLRARVPGACRVCALGEETAELHLSDSDLWEGEAVTGGGGGQLRLAACWDRTSSNMAVLLCFDVQDAL